VIFVFIFEFRYLNIFDKYSAIIFEFFSKIKRMNGINYSLFYYSIIPFSYKKFKPYFTQIFKVEFCIANYVSNRLFKNIFSI